MKKVSNPLQIRLFEWCPACSHNFRSFSSNLDAACQCTLGCRIRELDRVKLQRHACYLRGFFRPRVSRVTTYNQSPPEAKSPKHVRIFSLMSQVVDGSRMSWLPCNELGLRGLRLSIVLSLLFPGSFLNDENLRPLPLRKLDLQAILTKANQKAVSRGREVGERCRVSVS